MTCRQPITLQYYRHADRPALPASSCQAGLAQWPQSPYLNLIYANFLIEVRGNIQSGWLQLEAARKQSPNLSFQFSIFSREQVGGSDHDAGELHALLSASWPLDAVM